jgi:SAM-dependent methyltransferase
MLPRIYSDLVEWYPMLDPVEDHADEVAVFLAAFDQKLVGRNLTLLELGSGAGNNAFYLKQRFKCSLVDLSSAMLDLSRRQNPECTHIESDMRTVRLGRTFDAVFVHDAICHMTTKDDLEAAIQTAWEHTRPGGVALFAPDHVKETFKEGKTTQSASLGDRRMEWTEQTVDPDSDDSTYNVEFDFVMRHGAETWDLEDRFVLGLFPRNTWMRLLEDVGFKVKVQHCPFEGFESYEVFVCSRPQE